MSERDKIGRFFRLCVMVCALAVGHIAFGWEGQFQLNSGTRDDTAGIVRHTSGWATLAQNGTAVWNLSGDAKVYMTAADVPNQSLHIATTLWGGSNGTINILENSPEVVFYSERIYMGTFAPGNDATMPNADFSFNQNSGSVYLRDFHAGNRTATGDNHTACTYNLTGGTLVVGTTALGSEDIGGTTYAFKSPTISLTGGTFAFGEWGESLENKGSTIQIHGDVLAALTNTSYTYEKLAAGEKPALTQYGTSSVKGDFTQTAGRTVLDYGGTTSDKLTATGNIAINGGEIYLALDPYTVNPTSASQFTAFEAGGTLTVAGSVPVRTSYSG